MRIFQVWRTVYSLFGPDVSDSATVRSVFPKRPRGRAFAVGGRGSVPPHGRLWGPRAHSWGQGPHFTFVEDGERLPAAGVQAAGSEGEPGWDGEAGDGQAGGDVAGSEELLVQQLVNGGAGSGVRLEHLLDEGGGHGVDVLGQRAGEP